MIHISDNLKARRGRGVGECRLITELSEAQARGCLRVLEGQTLQVATSTPKLHLHSGWAHWHWQVEAAVVTLLPNWRLKTSTGTRAERAQPERSASAAQLEVTVPLDQRGITEQRC